MGDVARNSVDTVAIAVNHIAGADLETANLDRLPKVDDICVRVRHGNAAGEEMKSGLLHGWQVANSPAEP